MSLPLTPLPGLSSRTTTQDPRGTALRGLHYQLRQTQGKLVRVLAGEIFDVAVDLRRAHPRLAAGPACGFPLRTGCSSGCRLASRTGFYITSDWAEVVYKATDYYAPEWERSLWNDPQIGISQPLSAFTTPAVRQRSARKAARGCGSFRRPVTQKAGQGSFPSAAATDTTGSGSASKWCVVSRNEGRTFPFAIGRGVAFKIQLAVRLHLIRSGVRRTRRVHHGDTK